MRKAVVYCYSRQIYKVCDKTNYKLYNKFLIVSHQHIDTTVTEVQSVVYIHNTELLYY